MTGTTSAAMFACDGCQREYRWKPELAGARVRCKCGHKMHVPAEAPEAVVELEAELEAEAEVNPLMAALGLLVVVRYAYLSGALALAAFRY